MDARHCHVMRDEVALPDQVAMLDGNAFAKVGLDRCEDLLPAVPPLRSGGMVNHVLSDEFVDDIFVALRSTTEQLLHHCLRFTSDHPPIRSRSGVSHVEAAHDRRRPKSVPPDPSRARRWAPDLRVTRSWQPPQLPAGS